MNVRLCSIDGCNEKHHSTGYCLRHYMQVRRGKEVTLDYTKKTKKVCSIDGCNDKVHAKGYCKSHYEKDRRTVKKG
ncbi:hypothetical protein ACQUY5_32980 [Bacillus cereus]|uniref:hypothetical protein n=1 Tax=Bacillus cereus TaxID=1396 RepID=UPI003D16688F